jgi:hypothetical protein
VKCPGANVQVDELGAQPAPCGKAAPAQQNLGVNPESTPAAGGQPNSGDEPSGHVAAGPATPTEAEAETSSPPGTDPSAPADEGDGGGGVVESIKKALESIFN